MYVAWGGWLWPMLQETAWNDSEGIKLDFDEPLITFLRFLQSFRGMFKIWLARNAYNNHEKLNYFPISISVLLS